MPKHQINVLIGKRLKACRKMAGFTQIDLGNRMGIRPQQIGKYEHGIDGLSLVRLCEIFSIFHLPMGDFLEGLIPYDAEEESPLNIAAVIKNEKMRLAVNELIKVIAENERERPDR